MNPVSPPEENTDSVGNGEVPRSVDVDDGGDEDEVIMQAIDRAEAEEGHLENAETPREKEFDDSEEAVVPRQLRRPNQPTQKQIDEHRCASHIPYRSWCKWCVGGRGLHDPHKTGVEEDKLDKSIPCISMDYVFMGDSETSAEHNPILASYDNATDNIQVYVTRRKGAVIWLPRAMNADLEAIGYGGCRVSLKSDQEKAVLEVKRALAGERSSPTSMLESPVRESQANGKMERAVLKWSGHLRTLKLALEDNIGSKIGARSHAFDWLCHWSATSLNRYHIGSDGKTAMARVTGTQCSRTIAEFGEQVLIKHSGKQRKNKAESQWEECTFLGLRARTGEVFVADKDGRVKRCRTMRARPPAERWRADRVLGIVDSVAVGVYKFAKASSDESGSEDEEPEAEKIVPVGGEDEVADLFMSDHEDDQSVEKDDEPNTLSSDSVFGGEVTDDDDPSRMNLLEDIKELENSLSHGRMEENRRIIMMVVKNADITEVFSPPRIAEAAREMGLLPGESMDLLTGWDFSKSADRQRAIRQIREQKPFLVVGSPPCTLFSILQGLNKHKLGAVWAEKFEERKKEAVRHIDFCAAIYRLQSASGRYWLHEHPEGASSWNLKVMLSMHKLPGVMKVKADQCAFGLTTKVEGMEKLVKKPIGFLTNSWCIAKELERRCDKSHSHFSLMEGRAKDAAMYPPRLCQAVCKGLQAQKEYDRAGTVNSKTLGSIELRQIIADAGYPKHWIDEHHEDSEEDKILKAELLILSVKNGVSYAYDDVSGAALPVDMVKEARKLEIEYVRKMGVWTKVPRAQAAGKKIIKLRWLDVNKMDQDNPMIRSRIVAKEYNDGVDPNMFAATPPIEALRYLLSKAATHGEGKQCIMLNDVSRAFFNAKVTREVYVQLPAEDLEPGDKDLVGKLNLCLYGTRDAAMHWQECVADQLAKSGFIRSKAYPSLYYHPSRKIHTIVHGDDYVSTGTKDQLQWLKKELEATFEIKTDIIGLDDAEIKTEGKILNRLIRVDANGWQLEADPRHAELLAEELQV